MSGSASPLGYHDHLARAMVWIALLLIGVHTLLLLQPGPYDATWLVYEFMGSGLMALSIAWARYRMRNEPVKPVERADERERMLAGAAAQVVAACGFAALFLLSAACLALPRILQPGNATDLLAWLAYLMLLLQFLVLGLSRTLGARG